MRLQTTGPTNYVEGQTVRFSPVAQLAPNGHLNYRVRVLAKQEGVAFFASPGEQSGLTQPIVKQKKTTITPRTSAMPRFVVLEHDSPCGRHWDFMLEQENALATWALPQPPDTAEMPAEPLPDHRLAYLDYEGPISAIGHGPPVGSGDVSARTPDRGRVDGRAPGATVARSRGPAAGRAKRLAGGLSASHSSILCRPCHWPRHTPTPVVGSRPGSPRQSRHRRHRTLPLLVIAMPAILPFGVVIFVAWLILRETPVGAVRTTSIPTEV